MKINNNYNIQSQYLENFKNKQTQDIKTNRENQGSNVKIEISDSTKKLVREINKSKEGQFSEKVERIKKSILEGTYTISTEDIADKIMTAIENQKGNEK